MTTPFQQALEANDLAALRACPKADLHNHAVCGGDHAFLAAWSGRAIPTLDKTLHSMAEMHAWVDGHHGFLHTPEGRLKCIEASFVQAKLDGVTRLELGDDVWSSTLYDNSAVRVAEQLKHIHATAAPDIEWIAALGCSRHCRISSILYWMEPYLDLGVFQSFDLAGDELAQPIENFKPVYRRAKQAGLRLKAHAGEWTTDADDVRRAVEELELDEVQHGIAAATSPAVMRFLADHNIRLNICPTSNVMLGRVESLARHPIRVLFDAGVRVTINTDDHLIFGSSVSEEFLKLYRCGLFTAAELDRIRHNGLTD